MDEGEILSTGPKEFKSNEENLRKSDIVVAPVLFVFGVFMVIESLRMPVVEVTRDPEKWYAAPGLFPGFIGIVLALQAIILFIIGLKGLKETKGIISKADIRNARDFLKSSVFRRLVTAASLLFIYVVVMLGHIPYLVSTFIYLSANMLIFSSDKLEVRHVIKLLIISVISSGIVAYGFSHFALIPLP
jgi:putative tricarboxylic transport membrane protein